IAPVTLFEASVVCPSAVQLLPLVPVFIETSGLPSTEKTTNNNSPASIPDGNVIAWEVTSVPVCAPLAEPATLGEVPSGKLIDLVADWPCIATVTAAQVIV